MDKLTQRQKILDFVGNRWFTRGCLNERFAKEIGSPSRRFSDILATHIVEIRRLETANSWCLQYRILGKKEVA